MPVFTSSFYLMSVILIMFDIFSIMMQLFLKTIYPFFSWCRFDRHKLLWGWSEHSGAWSWSRMESLFCSRSFLIFPETVNVGVILCFISSDVVGTIIPRKMKFSTFSIASSSIYGTIISLHLVEFTFSSYFLQHFLFFYKQFQFSKNVWNQCCIMISNVSWNTLIQVQVWL